MKLKLIPSKKLAILSAAFCAAIFVFTHSTAASTLAIGDVREIGTSNPGTAGDGDRTLLVTHMIGMQLNTTDSYLGETIHRSGNFFGALPGPAVIGTQGGTTSVNLGAGGVYSYLWAKYDGPNYGAEVWFVGDLSGIITIPAASGENGQYGLSGWTLFGPADLNPNPLGSVPDGGATVMLLGTALGALGMARRYLKS